MDKNDIAALMEEDHPHLRKRRGSSTPDNDSLIKQAATRHNSVVSRPIHGTVMHSTRHSSLVAIPRHNSLVGRHNFDTLSVASKHSSVASATEKEEGEEGKAARRMKLAQLRDKVLNYGGVKMMELRRVSEVVKIDPKLRLVPFDRSALGDFQMLLSTFKEQMDEESALNHVYTSLNDMLHVIIKTMLEENDTLNNSKLARIVSAQAMNLFACGIYDIAATKSMPDGLTSLLMDLCGRISALDAFVRNYFVNEVHELEQIVNSLEDSLKQANQKVQSMQGDITAKEEQHKQRIAEMQLMSVIHLARSKAQAKPTALATAASDTKQEEAHNQLVKQYQELLEAHTKLKHDFEALQLHHDSTQLDLDKAQRKIATLLQTVEELSMPMALDKELQRVRNDLFCERMRVQELENEVQQLRGKQIDASRNRIHRNSLVSRIRDQTGLFPLTTSEEIADCAAGGLEEDSDGADDDDTLENSSFALAAKDPAFRLRSMINYTLPPPPKPPVQLSQPLALGTVTTVLQAVSKLKHQAHIESNLAIARPPATASADLICARKQIVAIFHRKQHLDECSAALNEPRPALVEVIVGYFFAKNTSPAVAQTEAVAFLELVNRIRSFWGEIRLFCEFLDGSHDEETLDFYIWLIQSIDKIHVGIEFDAGIEIQPQYITKFKASLINRTLFRVFKFRTCGYATQVQRPSITRLFSIDAMYDLQRIFESAAAQGPIYLSEFHTLLDLFLVTLDGHECYPLEIYLYAIVLMFKRQKDWFYEDIRLLFNKVYEEAYQYELRQRALEAVELRQTEATKAKRKAAQAAEKKKKIKKKKRKRPKATNYDGRKTAVLTPLQFSVVLARLDAHLTYGQISDMVVKVLSTRKTYSHGITYEAFVYTAQTLGWFRINFQTLAPLLAEVSVTAEEKQVAQKALQQIWDIHCTGIYVACESDPNPFIANHVMQIKQRLLRTLDQDCDKSDPVQGLNFFRHLLNVCWRVAALRGYRPRLGLDKQTDTDSTYFSIAELARSEELLLISKGILAIPDAVQGRQVFNSDVYVTTTDFLTNFSHIDPSRIRDLFPAHTIQTNECIAIDNVLHRYAWQLNDVYRTYSLICNDTFGITREGFQELIQDLGLASPHFTAVHMNLIFESVVSRQANPDQHKVFATSFIELIIRLAVEKSSIERQYADRKQSKLQIVKPERLSILVEDICTRYVLPNICQNLSITFRRQVAAPELQRLLNKHRNLLRRLFLYYCRQDLADIEAWKMNFSEFERFIIDFDLNDDVFFPSAMNLLVFNACQEDLNEGQFIYQEFVTAVIAIAQMKDTNPFLKWQRKTSNFIQQLIDFIAHPDRAVKFRLILS